MAQPDSPRTPAQQAAWDALWAILVRLRPDLEGSTERDHEPDDQEADSKIELPVEAAESPPPPAEL